jgi:cytochrome bd ubiquinol oxidase subunit I
LVGCSLLWWRNGKLWHSRALLRAWQLMLPSGFIAVLAGWYTAEIGRQPYVIYGLMRTAEAASPVAAGSVLTSLIVFGCVYLGVFLAGSWYLLKLLRIGPQSLPADQLHSQDRTAARPLSVPGEPLEEAHT